ncbi:MAG TPA: hypothetical protein VKE70_39400 [Candidatus Solibacter sp.]|nr:hypothetical protein [Candidatus Solibacter sp.]
MSNTMRRSLVAEVPAADSPTALSHFARQLEFETDCWDVHASLTSGARDFVVLDVRSPELYGEGHLGWCREPAAPADHGKAIWPSTPSNWCLD